MVTKIDQRKKSYRVKKDAVYHYVLKKCTVWKPKVINENINKLNEFREH
jgi:hypothetical protein